MSEKEKIEIILLIKDMDSKMDRLSSEIESIQGKLIIKLTSIMVIIVGIAFVVNAWLFDHKIDFLTTRQADRIDRLENAVFISQNKQLMNMILELKAQSDKKKQKPQKTKHKKR